TSDARARQAFDALSYTDRKELARSVAEAKREETRSRRVANALALLRAGKTP
ncbi:MAG: YdeI/OmpD-associated family protein, partial [Solirubrobacterales bacterium]|nr:YdeI/OmpD-associated family protein [Solirubrobacterales bacterium]